MLFAAYMQEIGRAGRDGQPSRAILYFNASDIAPNKEFVKEEIKSFCTTSDCRRDHLLKHFNYEPMRRRDTERHLCCDNCVKHCICDACITIKEADILIDSLDISPPVVTSVAQEAGKDMLLTIADFNV